MTTSNAPAPPAMPPVPAAPAEVMRFAGVTKTYPECVALAAVDLCVCAGQIVSVVGPSGCGKSTLLHLAGGLTEPTTGHLTASAQRLSYVFQDPNLMPWRSVLANTAMPLRARGVRRTACHPRAERELRRVGLDTQRNALPRQLSGGQKMRVSLARALVSDPDLMLLDEPFAALDAFTRERLAGELLQQWRNHQFAALFVTHSIREAVLISHKIVVMASRPGRILTTLPSPSPPPPDPTTARDTAALEDTGRDIASLLEAA